VTDINAQLAENAPRKVMEQPSIKVPRQTVGKLTRDKERLERKVAILDSKLARLMDLCYDLSDSGLKVVTLEAVLQVINS
jgi:hypothetical protein